MSSARPSLSARPLLAERPSTCTRGPPSAAATVTDQNVVLEYATGCQHGIVPGRHPDRGSSCCAMFASAVACGMMVSHAEFQVIRLGTLLHGCVLAYDDLGPQACAGSAVAEMARTVFEDSGVSISCQEEVVNRDRLQALGDELLRGTLPAGMLLTAIPATACGMQVTGTRLSHCSQRTRST